MRFGLLFPLVTIAISCQDKSSQVIEIPNNPPVADAGIDQSLSADEEIRLDGGGSFDPDGDPMTYNWSFARVPEGSSLMDAEDVFSDNNTSSSITTFLPDMMGTYIVSLAVTDSNNDSSIADSVIVSVSEGTLPTAVAGEDQSITQGEVVTLDGSSSFDSGGRNLQYMWSVSSSPEGSTALILEPTSASPAFTPDLSGNYLISLVVDSGVNTSAPDVMVLSVASQNPEAPVAVATQMGDTEDCSDIQLDGSGSSDPNGDPLSYFWTLQEKPQNSTSDNRSITDRDAVMPEFYADVAGEYVFSLAVYDGLEWSSPVLLPITLTEKISNSIPAVNAGNSRTLDAGNASCTSSTSPWWPYETIVSCGSCDSLSVELGQGASVNDPNGDEYSVQWSSVVGDVSFGDEYSINTTATFRGAEATAVNSCSETDFELQLEATDCPGGTGSDTVSFTVLCCGVSSN